ncbi:MAG: ScyD/ScyE family protein [Thermoleophilaceae bacterium]|nr:ScyD/ScyE family protein [Thermoleophilaceae bacterium]
MRTFSLAVFAAVAVVGLVASAPASARTHGAKVSVFASGLNNPRGLKFGPDRRLYVAEGGLGGSNSTTPAQCAQVVPPVGPYTGSTNDDTLGGRISRISRRGSVTHLVTGLPSSQTSAATGGSVSGAADVAFIRGRLYALLAGAGCSHGVPTVPNGVIRVRSNGSWSLVADLSAFLAAHPVARPEAADFEPDGTWYSMIASRGVLYAVEPNHGELDRITPRGNVSRVVDISASQGHVVPTALVRRGVFYVGNLGEFGAEDQAGDEHVFAIDPNGRLRVRASGLEKVLGLAFRGGRLYALEMSTSGGDPVPGTGRIVRVRAGRADGTVVSGLTFPTAMTVGPRGVFYVSERGFGFGAGGGRVLRVAP